MCVCERGLCPQVNNFEQVSSDDHQMSVAGREYPRSLVRGCTIPCDLSHDACDVTYHPCEQTDACEKIACHVTIGKCYF